MKYDYFQNEKLEYEDIEVPEELLLMVRQTVAADRRKKAIRKRAYILKIAGSAAAVLFLSLTIGVNSSYAFAETAVKIPIVKGVAKAVVVRSYRPEIIAVYEQNVIGHLSKDIPEEIPEKQPEEIVSAENGNDVTVPEEILEQPAEQMPEKVLSGLDAWKTEMTLEKLGEVTDIYTSDMEKQYADMPEKLRTILLAELPENDISLYGYHEGGEIKGTALRIGNMYQYFDWKYMNDSGKLPDLACEDIDRDGEEEIIVLLYNGALQKKEISKEEIVAPDEQEAGAAGNENGAKTAESVAEAMTSVQEIVSTDGVKEVASGDNEEELLSVSGNDVETSTENEEEQKQPAGELWVVCPKGENWSASVLSVNDYESQILHQLKAAYDEKKGTVQLYLMEEPFGEPIELPVENQAELTYESINLASARKYMIKDGLFLQFQMEVSLLKADGEQVSVLLERGLETAISLEEGSLVTGEIKER